MQQKNKQLIQLSWQSERISHHSQTITTTDAFEQGT